MARRLRASVDVHQRDAEGNLVRTVTFRAGEVPPAWAAALITNPKAWEDVDDDVEVPTTGDLRPAAASAETRRADTPGAPRKPNRAGRGASREVWAAYADACGIPYPTGASRDEIIAAVDAHEAKG